MSNNNQKNFYQGQNVLAEDLNNLQAYSDKNRNILVSDLLGYGILNGFVVTHKTDLAFSVSPGVAFDGNGNRLILEESTDVDLTKHVSTNGKSEPIKIRIKHSYIGSEPKKDSQDIETLTILTPSVKFITDETPEENLFQIATITLNEHADPLITRGEIFIALPDLTTTVSKNKVEIDKKVDDNKKAIENTNTDVSKNTSGVANLSSMLSKSYSDSVLLQSDEVQLTLSKLDFDIFARDSISLYTSGSSTSMSRGIVLSTDRDINLNTYNGGHVKINGKSIHPIGMTYVQESNKRTGNFNPLETPASLFGGAWDMIGIEVRYKTRQTMSFLDVGVGSVTTTEYPDGKVEMYYVISTFPFVMHAGPDIPYLPRPSHIPYFRTFQDSVPDSFNPRIVTQQTISTANYQEKELEPCTYRFWDDSTGYIFINTNWVTWEVPATAYFVAYQPIPNLFKFDQFKTWKKIG